jgi:hypothetical protein
MESMKEQMGKLKRKVKAKDNCPHLYFEERMDLGPQNERLFQCTECRRAVAAYFEKGHNKPKGVPT